MRQIGGPSYGSYCYHLYFSSKSEHFSTQKDIKNEQIVGLSNGDWRKSLSFFTKFSNFWQKSLVALKFYKKKSIFLILKWGADLRPLNWTNFAP